MNPRPERWLHTNAHLSNQSNSAPEELGLSARHGQQVQVCLSHAKATEAVELPDHPRAERLSRGVRLATMRWSRPCCSCVLQLCEHVRSALVALVFRSKRSAREV